MRGSRKNKLIDFYLGVPLVYLLGLIKKIVSGRKVRPESPRRVLFIKLAAIGDTILFLSVIEAFRKEFPDARIDLLASTVNQDLLGDISYIDQVHILPLGKGGNLGVLNELIDYSYDVAIDGEQWSRFSPLAAFYARIKYLIGFRTRGQLRHFLYDEVVEHGKIQPERDSFAQLVASFGVSEFAYPGLSFAPGTIEKAAQIRQKINPEESPLMIIHPGCGIHGWQREWPVEKYTLFVEELRKNFKKLCVVLTGGPAEVELNEKLAGQIRGEVHNLGGQLSLMEMSCLISQANLFVSGNTGPMHIAGAVDTPLIALHGPTNAEKWGPLCRRGIVIESNLECSPCLFLGFEYGCQDNTCMQAIEVETVVRAASRLLQTEPLNA